MVHHVSAVKELWSVLVVCSGKPNHHADKQNRPGSHSVLCDIV